MWGKSYKMGRTIGRAGMNTDIRMNNRAEAGMGLVTLIGLALFLAFILAMIGVI